MNGEDIFIALIAGLSVPLAISGAARSLLGNDWPVQRSRFAVSNGFTAIALAVLAGPGILIDRLVEDFRNGNLDTAEAGLAAGAAFAWAMLYGFVLLGLITRLDTAIA
jgi:hypothetical protein